MRCPAIIIPNCMRHSKRRLYHPTANENINCYDDRCDLFASSTWFLLCRNQDTFICIQHFEHEKNEWPGRESRSRVTAPCHVELGLGRGLLAIPGMGELGTDGEMRIGVFLLVGFVDRGCCWCFFRQSFFSSGAGTSTCFLAGGTLRVSCDQLCAQVSKYQDLLSIKHVSNIQDSSYQSRY